MLCTVEFESIQIMLLTAWCPGHRLGGIGCVQDDSQVDCLSSSCIHGHIVQKQRCSHTSRLNGFFGFVGSVRLVMLRRPHQAAGTEFRTPALCNSLPFLEAHSEGSNSAACKSITAPLKRGTRYSDGVNHISLIAFTAWFLDVQRRDQNSHRAQTPQ